MSDVNIGTVKAKLEVDASGAEDGVRKASAALEGFSTQSVAAGAAIGSAIGIIAVQAFEQVANAALGAARALAETVTNLADYSERIERFTIATGLSAEAVQSLEKASTAAGVSGDALMRSIQRLEVAAGNDSKAFAALGLSLKEVRDASPEELLGKVMDKLIPMADIAERNAQAQKLLGRSFADAAVAYKEYEESASSYINLTTEQLAAGKEMDSNLDDLKTAWGELGKEIGAALNTPEVRESIKALAGFVRDMVIQVRDGTGIVGGFFKMIADHAANAAKYVVFLGGAIDGLKERMASATKDTPGAIARGTEALDAFQAKIDAAAGKDLGNKLFPNLGADLEAIHRKFNPSEGPDRSKEIEAEQKRQDTIAALLQKARTSAAIEGKRIMDAQFKEAEKHVKDQIKQGAKTAEEERKIAKENANAIIAIDKSKTDMLQRHLRDGTLSVHEEYNIRRALISSQNQEEINDLEKRRLAATDPAIVAAIDEEIRKWRELTESEVEATREMERYAQMGKLAGDVGKILGGIADVFDAIGISADSAIGKIVGGLQQAAASVQNFSQQTTTVGKISSGLSAAAGIFRTGQEKGAAAGALSGAATGAAIGTMIAPGIGTAVGAIAGVLIGIGGALKKPEFKKIMNDVGKSWGVSISEGLAKEIEGIAKANKISRSLAELLDVSKIIGESGKDPREFTAKISDLMNAIKSGAVPAAQGLAELGKAFNQVAEAALKSGNIGDKALVGLLKRARELGQVTPEMKEFVAGQLSSAVEGVQKLIEVMPPETAAKAGSSGALLAATFNAIAAEQGILAASAALGPAYDSLMGQISKAGLAIPEALQSIGRQMELGRKPEFAAASQAAAATSQVLTGLGNAGYMDTSVLGASADVAKQTFDQAKNAGATDKEAYQLIGSLLSDIKNASIQSGQELSGVAQELISGAQAEGVVIQGDQLSVLVDIRNILAGGGYTPGGGATGTGGGFGGTSAETGGITGAGDVFTAPPSATYHERELRHFAGGSYGVQDFGAGTPAILHGREAVVTEKQMSNMGGGISFHPVFMTDAIQTNESRADLSKFQIDEFVRQVINNPLFQQILRDQGLRG